VATARTQCTHERALTPSVRLCAETSVGLPFFQIEGTVVEWDEVRFDVRLMQRVPYEGVSRMQTSLRRKHRDRVVRRGLALIIESDFYATDAGRQHFADQLTSIRYCVQETCSERRASNPCTLVLAYSRLHLLPIRLRRALRLLVDVQLRLQLR